MRVALTGGAAGAAAAPPGAGTRPAWGFSVAKAENRNGTL